jgi:phosphonate transport system substrate-binding protein
LFKLRRFALFRFLIPALAALSVLAFACGGDDDSISGGGETLYIGGIPDQDISVLEKRFNLLAEYLTEETGIQVEYLPSADYAAVVTGFRNGDIHMAWYGGLTGVQARLQVEGAVAVVQRETDEAFHSVFVAAPGSGIDSLEDIRDKHFAFGSESSTSGSLMPRYFLREAGLIPEQDFASVTYSGSHDATWKLVEAGTADVGALNASVWQTRLEAGEIDTTKVDVFYTTPPYYDYHWVARPDLDDEFGEGETQELVDAMLAIDPANGGIQAEIYEAFESSKFIPTANENYEAIEAIGRDLGLIQ